MQTSMLMLRKVHAHAAFSWRDLPFRCNELELWPSSVIIRFGFANARRIRGPYTSGKCPGPEKFPPSALGAQPGLVNHATSPIFGSRPRADHSRSMRAIACSADKGQAMK